MIEVRLYGRLRKFAPSLDNTSRSIGTMKIENSDLEKVSDVLKSIKIGEEEVSHIFLNGEYSGLNRKISDGDRLAIFPKEMGLLYKWYFSAKE